MYTVVTCTPSPMISGAIERENASSAAFDARYAENRGVFVCSPIVEMLMMWPDFCAPHLGQQVEDQLDRLRSS